MTCSTPLKFAAGAYSNCNPSSLIRAVPPAVGVPTLCSTKGSPESPVWSLANTSYAASAVSSAIVKASGLATGGGSEVVTVTATFTSVDNSPSLRV